MTIEQIVDMSYNAEIVANMTGALVLSSAHAVNEQLVFVYDAEDQSVNIFFYLRPFKSFFRRLHLAYGYVTNKFWPGNGNWEHFNYTKDEAERLIGFLKKIPN